MKNFLLVSVINPISLWILKLLVIASSISPPPDKSHPASTSFSLDFHNYTTDLEELNKFPEGDTFCLTYYITDSEPCNTRNTYHQLHHIEF